MNSAYPGFSAWVALLEQRDHGFWLVYMLVIGGIVLGWALTPHMNPPQFALAAFFWLTALALTVYEVIA
jgi:hypothetical protein